MTFRQNDEPFLHNRGQWKLNGLTWHAKSSKCSHAKLREGVSEREIKNTVGRTSGQVWHSCRKVRALNQVSFFQTQLAVLTNESPFMWCKKQTDALKADSWEGKTCKNNYLFLPANVIRSWETSEWAEIQATRNSKPFANVRQQATKGNVRPHSLPGKCDLHDAAAGELLVS